MQCKIFWTKRYDLINPGVRNTQEVENEAKASYLQL